MKGSVFPASWGRNEASAIDFSLDWLEPPSDEESENSENTDKGESNKKKEEEEESNKRKRKRAPMEEDKELNEENPRKTLIPPYESLVSCRSGKRKSRTKAYGFPTQESGVYEKSITVSSSCAYASARGNQYVLDWTFGMPRVKEEKSRKRDYHTKKVSPTEESYCVSQRNGKRDTPSLTRSHSNGLGAHRGKFISEGQARMELSTLRKNTQIECYNGKWQFTSMQKLLKEVMRLSNTLPKFEFTEQTYGSPKWRNREVATESLKFIPDEVRGMDNEVHPIIIKGDGNCGPRSLSRVIWGTDEHHIAIRLWLGVEMLRHSDYYNEREKQFEWGFPKVVKEGLYIGGDIKRNYAMRPASPEWEDKRRFFGSGLENSATKRERLRNEFRSRIMKKKTSLSVESEQIKTEGYIDLLHLQAAANVFNRVIILYASETMGRYCQYYRYSFLPDRDPKNIVAKHPIALMWANNATNHFIPLVPIINRTTVSPVPSHDMPLWPIPKPYGFVKTPDGKCKQSGEMTRDEISEIVNKYTILTHPIMKDPK